MSDPRVPDELTATQLAYILFGYPLSADKGVIGRLEQRMDKFSRLGWAIFFTVLAAFLALVANLAFLVIQTHPHL